VYRSDNGSPPSSGGGLPFRNRDRTLPSTPAASASSEVRPVPTPSAGGRAGEPSMSQVLYLGSSEVAHDDGLRPCGIRWSAETSR
jgi:hypothetical protein